MSKLITIAAISLVATACGSSDTIAAGDLWGRPTPPGAENAAFYGTVTNNTDASVELVSASSPGCATIELHRSAERDGVMEMRRADEGDHRMGPGSSMNFAPLGLHIMCIGLVSALKNGESVDLSLEFDNGEMVSAQVAVEDR